MKTIKLILNFLFKSKVPAIILLFSYMLVLFISNVSFATYRYISYTRDIFVNYNNSDMYYCSLDYNPSEMIKSEAPDPINDDLIKIENEAEKYQAYQPFLKEQHFLFNFNGQQQNAEIYDKAMVEKYPLSLSCGTWEDLKIDSDEGAFTAIASGAQYDNVGIGDVIHISVNGDSLDPNYIQVKIVGKLSSPNAAPSFSYSGNIITADSMFGNLNGLIFLQSDELYQKLNSISEYTVITAGNFITTVDADSTDKQQQEYLEFLQSKFLVNSYDEIKDASDQKVDRELREKMPIPLFFMFIVSFSLLSMSVLFVNKNIRDHAIYFLCGCSRRRSYFIVASSVGLLGIVGGVVNVLFITSYNALSSYGLFNLQNVLFDGASVLFTMIYIIVTVGVSVALALAIFIKNTPIEIYRRFE